MVFWWSREVQTAESSSHFGWAHAAQYFPNLRFTFFSNASLKLVQVKKNLSDKSKTKQQQNGEWNLNFIWKWKVRSKTTVKRAIVFFFISQSRSWTVTVTYLLCLHESASDSCHLHFFYAVCLPSPTLMANFTLYLLIPVQGVPCDILHLFVYVWLI